MRPFGLIARYSREWPPFTARLAAPRQAYRELGRDHAFGRLDDHIRAAGSVMGLGLKLAMGRGGDQVTAGSESVGDGGVHIYIFF